jgi:hypothetical protein
LKLVAVHAITMNVLALLAVALGASLIFLHGGGIVDAVTAAFIVGLLVAGAALIAMRPKWLPLAAWIVALVLIAYAIVPLLAALVQGEGFSVALATNAPFPQFPFWLRGAYVASSMLLPLGAIWALAGCVAAVRARPAQAGRLLAFALAMVFAAQASGVVATATGAPTLVALESQSASGATPADANAALAGLQIPNDATADSAADATLAAAPPEQALSDEVKSLDDEGSRLKPADYDLSTRIDQLGPGVEPAFDFVRDQIGFESYSGIMRSWDGTFADRSGNAADRALLLAHILKDKGFDVRVARGQLNAADAARLYDRIFEAPKAVSAPNAVHTAAPPGTLDFFGRITNRARRDFAIVRRALGAQVPNAAVMSRDDVLKEIGDHEWVQADVNGTWTDLDPSFPDSKPGTAYCSATKTYTSIPDDLLQNVTIRVTTDLLANGTLTHATSLTETLPAYQLVDGQVYLIHTGAAGLFGNPDSYTPVLSVNGDEVGGSPIAYDDATKSGTGGMSGLNSAVNAFATGTPGPRYSEASPIFVAEWLEFETATPDGHDDVTRTPIIDRAGAAWRASATHDPAALAPLQRNASGLFAPQSVYNVVFGAGRHNLLAYAAMMRQLATQPQPQPQASGQSSGQSATIAQSLQPLALRDMAWMIASDQLVVPSLNDTPGLRFYADTPRIFVFSSQTTADSTPDHIYLTTDLRRDSLRAVARDPSLQPRLEQRQLWFGALEGALEHELTAYPSDTSSDVISTSSLAGSDGALAVRPGTAASSVCSDKETAARMQVALDAGDTLVVPKAVLSGGPAGWWQINGATGRMRAVLGEDLGGSAKFSGGYNPRNAPGGGSPTGNGTTWGNYGGKTRNPYSPGQAKPKGGGGEIGEYIATFIAFLESLPVIVKLGLLVVEVLSIVIAILNILS